MRQLAMIDWDTCPEVERTPDRVGGAWVFRGSRVPVRALFENLKDGASLDDFLEWFPGVTRVQVEAVLRACEESLDDESDGRIALGAVVEDVPPLTREDRRSLALHRAIARRLEEEPGPTLGQARRNLRKMEQQHAGARPLLSRWRALLDRPLEEILEVLVDPRPSARELRHVTPFAGVLNARERAEVYRQCVRTEARRPWDAGDSSANRGARRGPSAYRIR